MTEYKLLVDKHGISVGKALPFSIYDAQRKLLLAQGHMVESQRSLERLLRQGQYYRSGHSDSDARSAAEEWTGNGPINPLAALNRDYANIPHRSRCGVKIAPNETGESFLCWVIGVSHENRCLVMTAPARPDKALAPISQGQVWFCRMFSSTSVFRFRGAILKVAFEPYPHLHVLVPEVIERRNIRRTPRALVSLQATLAVPESHYAMIVDLSVGGARVGADTKLALDVGHALELVTTIEVLGRQEELRLTASVAVVYGTSDARHPDIAFYGLSFEPPDERTTLLLHGYVQEQLASEYDGLGQVLAMTGTTAE
jgi:PilZ domain/Flagellar protein YcgR